MQKVLKYFKDNSYDVVTDTTHNLSQMFNKEILMIHLDTARTWIQGAP